MKDWSNNNYYYYYYYYYYYIIIIIIIIIIIYLFKYIFLALFDLPVFMSVLHLTGRMQLMHVFFVCEVYMLVKWIRN